LLHSGTSIDMPEPSIGLIPPIVSLPPARDTTVTKVQLYHQDSTQLNPPSGGYDVESLRGCLDRGANGGYGPYNCKIHSSLRGGANIQPATRPTRTKACIPDGGRICNKPAGDGKPMILAQRLARATILSHVRTKETLHPPGISSSRRPFNFVSFPKFATPPSSPGKEIIK
jgi:hypothetical protein